MKNVQKPEKIHLGKLIKEIGKGRFVIPDFQREFDWEPWDVRELIKSIFMDYYIGTLLLWEGNKENYKKLSCTSIYAFKEAEYPEYIVLDGQQRLTALHYALYQPDENFRKRKSPIYFFIRLKELVNENYEEAFFYYGKTKYYTDLIADRNIQYEEHIFPLGIMKDGSWEIENWLKGYKNYWEQKAESSENEDEKLEYKSFQDNSLKLKDLFEDLLDNYQISYISLDKELELNKVCDIFTHINSKGKPLDTFDLLNSITRKEDIYLKDMYREASNLLEDNTYPGFEVKSYILMIFSILEQNYCSPKYLYYLVPNEVKKIKTEDGKNKEIILINDKETFVKKWNNAVNYLDKGLKSLKNPRDFGAISKNFLPYPSIIPALSAIKAYVDTSGLKSKVDIHAKIRKWYWASIFLTRYSSSVESTSTKDFMELKKWFANDDMEPDFILDFEANYKSLDLHKEVRNSSAIYKAIFNLFILNEARDWETFELPEYDSLDDHHIVPKSWGKNNDLNTEINTILNRTPLSAKTNREIINDDLPNIYLKRFFANNNEEKVYALLESHLISRKAVGILLRDPFTVDDYKEFIAERKSTILKTIENKIIQNKIELPEDLIEINSKIEKVELSLRQIIINNLELSSVDLLKEKIPQHVMQKLRDRIEKEKRRNPAEVDQKVISVEYWMQFSDLQELQQIITAKQTWSVFEEYFGTKEGLTNEFNMLAGIRNTIRHTRELDEVTQLKGKASILWFQKQLKIE